MAIADRGFASMDKEKQKAIASMGGKSAQASGRGHRFTPEETSLGGKAGGMKVSQNREHMVELGKLGGKASALKRSQQKGT